MLGCTRQTLLIVLVSLLFCANNQAWGQDLLAEDRPALYVPLKPPTRKEIERRDSLKQYVLGLLLERSDQLLEALKAFEEAGRLDPDAAAVFKAQVPLLLTLAREKDALAAIGKVLELDPGDHEMWFVAGRLNKAMLNEKEARVALKRGLEAPGIAEHPDVAQQIYLDLAGMCEACRTKSRKPSRH